jgi:hypothetical protein
VVFWLATIANTGNEEGCRHDRNVTDIARILHDGAPSNVIFLKTTATWTLAIDLSAKAGTPVRPTPLRPGQKYLKIPS